VSTTVITVVLSQNCIDLVSIKRGSHSGMCATTEVGNNVYRVQLIGVMDVTEGEDHEPMTSSLIRTDSGVGFMSVECPTCLVGIKKYLSLYKSVPVKHKFDSGEWFCQVAMTR